MERHIAQKKIKKETIFLRRFPNREKDHPEIFFEGLPNPEKGSFNDYRQKKRIYICSKAPKLCKNAVLKIIAPKKQSIFLERKHRPKKLKGTIFPHKGRALKKEQHITQSYSCKKKKQFLDGSKNKKNRAQKILFKHQGKK